MLSWFGNRSADVKRGGERKDGNVAKWRPQHDGFHYAKLHGDERLVRAALAVSEFRELHDAIEDCEVPRELIAKTFGAEIADLVAEVTDDKKLRRTSERYAGRNSTQEKSQSEGY